MALINDNYCVLLCLPDDSESLEVEPHKFPYKHVKQILPCAASTTRHNAGLDTTISCKDFLDFFYSNDVKAFPVFMSV